MKANDRRRTRVPKSAGRRYLSAIVSLSAPADDVNAGPGLATTHRPRRVMTETIASKNWSTRPRRRALVAAPPRKRDELALLGERREDMIIAWRAGTHDVESQFVLAFVHLPTDQIRNQA
jgi:hypothetical protein